MTELYVTVDVTFRDTAFVTDFVDAGSLFVNISVTSPIIYPSHVYKRWLVLLQIQYFRYLYFK